jgi:hypothetical protein
LTIDPRRESRQQPIQALAAAEARFSGAAAPAATDPQAARGSAPSSVTTGVDAEIRSSDASQEISGAAPAATAPHAAKGVEPNMVTTEEFGLEEDELDLDDDLQFLIDWLDFSRVEDQSQPEPAAPNELTRSFMDLLMHRYNFYAESPVAQRLRSILPAVESKVLAAMIHHFLERFDKRAETFLAPSLHSRSQSHPENGEPRQLRDQSDRKRDTRRGVNYACWICGDKKEGHYCLLPMTGEGNFVGHKGKKWKVRRLRDDESVRAASVSKGYDQLLKEATLMQSPSKKPRTCAEGSESGGESEETRHICNRCGFPLKEEHAKKCIFLPGSHTCTMSDGTTRMLAEPYDPAIHGNWEEVSKILTSASHGTADRRHIASTYLSLFLLGFSQSRMMLKKRKTRNRRLSRR